MGWKNRWKGKEGTRTEEVEGGREGESKEGEKTRSQNVHTPSVLLSQTHCEKALALPHRSFYQQVSRIHLFLLFLLSLSFSSSFSVLIISLTLWVFFFTPMHLSHTAFAISFLSVSWHLACCEAKFATGFKMNQPVTHQTQF